MMAAMPEETPDEDALTRPADGGAMANDTQAPEGAAKAGDDATAPEGDGVAANDPDKAPPFKLSDKDSLRT